MDAEAMGGSERYITTWDPPDPPTAFSQPYNCPRAYLASGSNNNNITDGTDLEPRETT